MLSTKCPPDKCPPKLKALWKMPSGQMPSKKCPPKTNALQTKALGGQSAKGICPEGNWWRAFVRRAIGGGHLSGGHLSRGQLSGGHLSAGQLAEGISPEGNWLRAFVRRAFVQRANGRGGVFPKNPWFRINACIILQHKMLICHMMYLSKTLFKCVRQAFYFLTLPWVIRDKTDLG